MVEQAFIVKRGSVLYEDYFETALEKQKFQDYAWDFFLDYDLMDPSCSYIMTRDLALQLNEEQYAKYESQLKKNQDRNGMWHFKKNSEMNKLWNEKVTSHINFDILTQMSTWFWPYIQKGGYSLWHDGLSLYGYLQDDLNDKLKLPDFFIPISMTEYVAAKDGVFSNDGPYAF